VYYFLMLTFSWKNISVQITQLSDVICAGVRFNPFVKWRNKVFFGLYLIILQHIGIVN
jgi:hypothetical protein